MSRLTASELLVRLHAAHLAGSAPLSVDECLELEHAVRVTGVFSPNEDDSDAQSGSVRWGSTCDMDSLVHAC